MVVDKAPAGGLLKSIADGIEGGHDTAVFCQPVAGRGGEQRLACGFLFGPVSTAVGDPLLAVTGGVVTVGLSSSTNLFLYEPIERVVLIVDIAEEAMGQIGDVAVQVVAISTLPVTDTLAGHLEVLVELTAERYAIAPRQALQWPKR